MPTSIPISERILRQLKRDLAGVAGISSVICFDANAATPIVPGMIIIDPGEDSPIDQPAGNPGPIQHAWSMSIAVTVPADPAALIDSSAATRRWIAALDTALAANTSVIEAVSLVRLAIDSEFGPADPPDYLEGLVACARTLVVYYYTDGDSPYKYGTAIPQLIE